MQLFLECKCARNVPIICLLCHILLTGREHLVLSPSNGQVHGKICAIKGGKALQQVWQDLTDICMLVSLDLACFKEVAFFQVQW